MDGFGSDSDTFDEDEMDEFNESYAVASKALEDGIVTCLNTDGTFRCPYSPSRKKQTYKFSEIHQHAEAVSKGNRGLEACGKHLALRKYLDDYLAEKAEPQVQRESLLQQEIPSRVDREDMDKPIFPWMGILQNIQIQTQNPNDSFRSGAWAADIREKLKDFNPESVKVLHNIGDHQFLAAVRFRKSMDGFKDAEAFENSFGCMGRGRAGFEKDYPNGCGTHLYGWMATNKDVEGSDKFLSEHLTANGELKSLPVIVRELEAQAQLQMQNLKASLMKKEDDFFDKALKNWVLTNKVEYVTSQLAQAQLEKNEIMEEFEKERENSGCVASLAAKCECGSSDPSVNTRENEGLQEPASQI